ncbi:AAA family ATPase [Pirellulales bacterium]|nr:AAA family ATPase [Pirellulales bacterium]
MTTTTYDQLVSKLSSAFDRLNGDEKHWIGLVGAPGSGKSTVAEAIRRRMPKKITVIPMDGYHYYRTQLDAMDDPKEAHARRGAPFTFDAERLVDELRNARRKGSGSFPNFDHNVGDPVENDIELRHGKQIVIVEGNYLLLDDPPWISLKNDVFDMTWFLDVAIDECRRRVEDRHVATGLTREEARYRVSTNDGPNAEQVRDASVRNASQIIRIAPGDSPTDEA